MAVIERMSDEITSYSSEDDKDLRIFKPTRRKGLTDNANAVADTGLETRDILQDNTDFFSPCDNAVTFKLQRKK